MPAIAALLTIVLLLLIVCWLIFRRRARHAAAIRAKVAAAIAFKPRVWSFPAEHADKILAARAAHVAPDGGHPIGRLAYYRALQDAGFDGFGHGNWRFSYTNCFPLPRLIELAPEDRGNG